MKNENLIPVPEFCQHHQIEFSFISTLSEYGLVEVTVINEIEYIDKEQIKELEKMIRMHYELDINVEGIDAITHLLKRYDRLNEELLGAKNRLRIYEGDK